MRWDPWIASYFACTRSFAMNATEFVDGDPPRGFVDFATGDVVAVAPHGVRLIRLSKPTDPPSNTKFKLFDGLPRVVRLSRQALRNSLASPEGAWLSITDGMGQEWSFEESKLKDASTLPPDTSKEQFAQIAGLAQAIGDSVERWSP